MKPHPASLAVGAAYALQAAESDLRAPERQLALERLLEALRRTARVVGVGR